MADKIYVNVEAAEEAVAMLEEVLEDWEQNGASAMKELDGIMDKQQADSAKWLGYILDDFAEKRLGEITGSVEGFIDAAKDFVEAFKQGDIDIRSIIEGEY